MPADPNLVYGTDAARRQPKPVSIPVTDPATADASRRSGRPRPMPIPLPAASRHPANAPMQADTALRDNRHPPIPHYRDSPDAETRTTAIPDVP
jgi:hypothetical protein